MLFNANNGLSQNMWLVSEPKYVLRFARTGHMDLLIHESEKGR